MARSTVPIALASLLLAAFLPAPRPAVANPAENLTVDDLKVEFVSETKVRVRGKVKLTGLVPSERVKPWSEITVHVDFPHGNEGFSLLPDCFHGKGTATTNRDDIPPSLRYRSKWHVVEKTKKRFFLKTWILRPAVIDRHLDNEKHEGRWIAFDKTLDFASMPEKERREYRIVFQWTVHGIGVSPLPRSTRGYVFLQWYVWSVYGPFPWGKAPACDKPLVGLYCRPASFTERGVEVEEPAETDKEAKVGGVREDEPPSEGAKPGKRPKLKRPDKPPTHLQAVEASEALQATLLALPEVEKAAVGLPPRRALIRVSTKAGLEPQALTKLVATIALETAYAAPWIDTFEMLLDGDRGGSRVCISWDALVEHAAGETTLAEFFRAWEVGGDPLAAPRDG